MPLKNKDLLFLLIRGLIWTLPLGIVAFSAQLSAQVSAGVVADSIGKYVLVVQGYNVLSVEHVEGTTHKVTIKK